MTTTTPIRNLLAGQTLSADERERLLRTAHRLCSAAQEGHRGTPLRGRHVAIAVSRPRERQADPLEIAVTRLGARVSVIDQRALVIAPDPSRLGRLLGNLYDAVDCDALSPEEARELQRVAGVPVFDGLACADHPIRSLLPTLQATEKALGPDEALSSLLQAALLETMS